MIFTSEFKNVKNKLSIFNKTVDKKRKNTIVFDKNNDRIYKKFCTCKLTNPIIFIYIHF